MWGGRFGGNVGGRRYNRTTGAFIDFFANSGSDLYAPVGITFGPDNNLYVATSAFANVMRFNYPSGTFMDFFVPNGGGGARAPVHPTLWGGPAPVPPPTLGCGYLPHADHARLHRQTLGGEQREDS